MSSLSRLKARVDRLQMTYSEFTRRKRQVAGLLRVAGDAAGGLWVILDLHRAWHVSALLRALRELEMVPGVPGSRVKRLGVTAFAALTPPIFVWRASLGAAGPSTHSGGKQVLVTKHDGGLVFDHRARRVTHYRAQPLPTAYRENRNLLSEHFEIPAFELSADRRVLRERLLPGMHLADAPLTDKLVAAHSLLRQSAEVVRQHHTGVGSEVVGESLELILQVLPDGELARQVREVSPSLLEQSQNWPEALSHGDLTPLNVLVPTGVGAATTSSWSGQPTVIDLEDARPLPYFYDAFSVLGRDPELWRATRSGEFDVDLDRIRLAAGGGDPLDLLMAARAVAVIAAADHCRRYGGDVTRTLAQLWRAHS